ncbi:helix-turn-helix transcriptional regulator [Saccharopolyspora taberi]|uniref:HTH cro/C1-type domain-containing protein n=1 Tax=Saccharopolyspora taberi TaxID=60895 RepID=A0ABN3VHD0_9PSEU
MPQRRAELAAARRAVGHTQEALAHRLGLDVSSVARWERGVAMPSPSVRRALARELAVPLGELDALLGSTAEETTDPTAADRLIRDRWSRAERDELVSALAVGANPALTRQGAVRVAHHWLVTDSPMSVESPERGHRRLGTGTVERIDARVRHLRDADDVLPGGELHQIIRSELAATTGMLRGAHYGDATGRRLLAAIAQLCELAGWSTADAGQEVAAENYYLRGIGAAHAAGDQVLAAHLVSSLAYHLAESGHGADAVLLARSALARVRGRELAPAVRALLHARLAWAHAKAGNRAESRAAMDRAQEHHAGRGADDPEPDWVYWLTAEQMDIIVGRCDTALGRPDTARDRIDAAIRKCDPRHAREYALYTTWLAEAHLRAHDTERALALAAQAQRIDASIASSFSHRAVAGLSKLLAVRR